MDKETRLFKNIPTLILAAPSSGSGKTILTLGILHALIARGRSIATAKVGPDFIDPMFHRIVTGRPSITLDPWAMSSHTLSRRVTQACQGCDMLLVEGVMGLFDGGTSGIGSTASLAQQTGWPLVLIVDASKQAQSIGALIHGFKTWNKDITIVGCIINRVKSTRHQELIKEALSHLDIPLLGMIPYHPQLILPERHLGLIPPSESHTIDSCLKEITHIIGKHLDLDRLYSLAHGGQLTSIPHTTSVLPIMPLGQRIALAYDHAFCFFYPHFIDEWYSLGAEIVRFSPLADESPMATCDVVILPGGYPELHAARLSHNRHFLDGLIKAANRGVHIYGECGGYMTLGTLLEDAKGHGYPMAGLLPVETSFARPVLHLGYRRVDLLAESVLGQIGTVFRAHEFHYSSVLFEDTTHPLFQVYDALGNERGTTGMSIGTVCGSFIHLIDREMNHESSSSSYDSLKTHHESLNTRAKIVST